MSPRRSKSRHRLLLTDRALRDIREIESYSAQQWGTKTAHEYIGKIEAALDRIAEMPELLREEPAFADSLRFHRVQKHVLVCDVQDRAVYVLAVLHTGMDIANRLAELMPQLSIETALLHRKVTAVRKRNRR
ncbi:MAG: type II toxin-antitoxin system RelE/ParE family toxin [Thermoguttaceae bacterium]